MRTLMVLILAAALAIAPCCTKTDSPDFEKLNSRAAKEYLVPVRPGYEGRQPFWNTYATKFIFAPAFDFAEVEGAAEYRFDIYHNCGFWEEDERLSYKEAHMVPQAIAETLPEGAKPLVSFVADSPKSPLSPVWNDIPVGKVTLLVTALDASGKDLGYSGGKRFFRDFPFCGPYNTPVRPAKEVATMALIFIHSIPGVANWENSRECDLSYKRNTYPSKIVSATIRCELMLGELIPEYKESCLKRARNAAAFLISVSRPEGSALEYFTPTYYKDLSASKFDWNLGKTMMMEPVESAMAFLDLYDATQEEQYLDRALKIVGTYKRLQAPDGSLPVKVDFETGEPVNGAKASLTPLLGLLRRLERQYGITEFKEARLLSEKWMKEEQLEKLDFTGQFEDITVLDLDAYQNLTNCTVAPYVTYIMDSDEVSAKDIADARELMDFCEDQFVHWDCLRTETGLRPMITPCTLEQYHFRAPIDDSAANMVEGWLGLYEKTGDELILEKAKAMASSFSIAQNTLSGRLPTYWSTFENYVVWANCTLISVEALMKIEKYEKPI